MHQNRPFFSTNTNLYDESFRSSAPTTLNGQNVILSQEQQRRIYDTLNTSIVGNNFGLNATVCPGNVHVLHSQKQNFPGGTMFTFCQPQSQPQQVAQGTCCKCPISNPASFDHSSFLLGLNTFFPSSAENQIRFTGVQQCGLDNPVYNPQTSRNPFELKFHHDRSASCSDLLSHFTQIPPSKGYPDLSNIIGAAQQTPVCEMSTEAPLFFPLPPIEFSSNAKKLVLSKNIAATYGHVVEDLEENQNPDVNKKKVSFSDGHSVSSAINEKSSQITSDCICDAKKCKSKTKTKKTKKQQDDSKDKETKRKKREKTNKDGNQNNIISSDTTASSDGEESHSEKSKKSKWWNIKQKRHEGSSSERPSSDTEGDQSESKRNKRKINKKPKKENAGSLLSDDKENTSDSSNQQSSLSENSTNERS